MNLSWIDDFIALASTGNFSRAAEERHMTQPAFSRRVRALEQWLGVDLFDRSSQPARLTDAGLWFRSAAQDLQVHVTRLPGEARAVAEAGSQTLRFAATHALSFTFLPIWLRALEAQTTIGRVQLESDTQHKCESLLQQSRVQFMLAHVHPQVRGLLDGDGFQSIVVGSDRLLPLSAADAHGRPSYSLWPVGDGGSVDVLGYSAESGLGRIFRSLRGQALERLPTRTVLTAHLASVLRTMALDGRGLAWLPQVLVEDDLASGRLVLAASDEWCIDLQVCLYRERATLSRAADALWSAAAAASSRS